MGERITVDNTTRLSHGFSLGFREPQAYSTLVRSYKFMLARFYRIAHLKKATEKELLPDKSASEIES